MDDADVVIIGSGLAGLSAAYKLADKGRRVLILEAEDVIGGRTASWDEEGMQVESGLHKFLGVYRALPRLLKQSGVDPDDILTWVDAMELHARDGKSAYFTSSPYRHPIATLGSYLSNNHFVPFSQKMRLLAMGAAGMTRSILHPKDFDKTDIASYARGFGIEENIIDDVIHTLTTGVFFLPASSYSAYASFAPAVEALKRGLTFRIGAFNGGMTDVMINPIAETIRKKGGTILTGKKATSFILDRGAVTGVATDDELFRAPAVVLATSLRPAQELIKSAFANHAWFKPMLDLRTVPVVTFQCELREPLLKTDHTHFSNTAVCCFAEQSHTTFRDLPGRFSAILFPPEKLLKIKPEDIRALVETDMEKMGLPIRDLITRYRVVNHPSDFYAIEKGSERLRPLQKTPIPGFALAGDYTKQPFLASMEGAVISGERAARALTDA